MRFWVGSSMGAETDEDGQIIVSIADAILGGFKHWRAGTTAWPRLPVSIADAILGGFKRFQFGYLGLVRAEFQSLMRFWVGSSPPGAAAADNQHEFQSLMRFWVGSSVGLPSGEMAGDGFNR